MFGDSHQSGLYPPTLLRWTHVRVYDDAVASADGSDGAEEPALDGEAAAADVGDPESAPWMRVPVSELAAIYEVLVPLYRASAIFAESSGQESRFSTSEMVDTGGIVKGDTLLRLGDFAGAREVRDCVCVCCV